VRQEGRGARGAAPRAQRRRQRRARAARSKWFGRSRAVAPDTHNAPSDDDAPPLTSNTYTHQPRQTTSERQSPPPSLRVPAPPTLLPLSLVATHSLGAPRARAPSSASPRDSPARMVVLAASVVTKTGKGELAHNRSRVAKTKKRETTTALLFSFSLSRRPPRARSRSLAPQPLPISPPCPPPPRPPPCRTNTRAALVSRQYADMSRIRIEGLLAAFPKLVGAGKQHTYVETDSVRYVYQPMEVRP
jgi:hypothetical protein